VTRAGPRAQLFRGSASPRDDDYAAPGADVDVELSYRDHALQLRVRDYGPSVLGGEPVAGHGLLGMRERATLAGGTFSSGPAEGGGFEVDVTLPTAETAP
jgi:signal transduction histidine kinase